MDRRKFLQTLTALGASVTLPAQVAASDNYIANLASFEALPNNGLSSVWSPETDSGFPRIGVVSVGGAGGIILTKLAERLPHLCRSIAIDTNPFAQRQVTADHKLLFGNAKRFLSKPREATPLAGTMASEIFNAVSDLDFVFIIAGMGGWAGTEIAHIVAKTLNENNIRAFCTAIMPFDFEGRRRMQVAISGTRSIGVERIAVLPISNEVLAQASGDDATLDRVLGQVDLTIEQVYRNITNAATGSGFVGVDLEDASTVLNEGGRSAFGVGVSSGPDCAEQATRYAIASPLLGMHSFASASGLLIAIEGSPHTLKMKTVNNVMDTIQQCASPKAHCIVSTVYSNPVDELKVSILATGLQAV